MNARAGEIVAGGREYYGRYRDGQWLTHPHLGGLIRAIERLPGAWLLFSHNDRGRQPLIWLDGENEARPLGEEFNDSKFFKIGEEYWLVSPQLCTKWNGRELVRVEKRPVEMPPDVRYVAIYGSEYFGVRNDGVFNLRTGEYVVKEAMPSLVTGLVVTEKYIVVSSLSEGITGWERQTGRVAWRVSGAEQEYVTCLWNSPEGIYVGSRHGLFLIHPMEQTALLRFPRGQLPRMQDGPAGPLYLSPWGIFSLSTGAPYRQNGFFGYGFANGREIFGGDRFIVEGDRRLSFINLRPFSIFPLTDGYLVRIEMAVVRLNKDGEEIKRIECEDEHGAQLLARREDGKLLIAEGGRVAAYDDELQFQGVVLPEKGRVFPHQDGVWITNEKNEIFDGFGRKQGELPAGSVKDVTLFRGRLVASLWNSTGESRILGYVTPRWQPVHFSSMLGKLWLLHVHDDQLYVAGEDIVVRMSGLEPQGRPSITFSINAEKHGRRWEMKRGEADLTLQLTQRSVPGEIPPRFTYAFNHGPEVALADDARIRVSRPPWGESTVRVRRDFLGVMDEERIEVYCPYPLWLSWWALGGYGAGLSGGFWSLYRWRTGVLRRRAHDLERKIEERTAELVQAKQAREYFISAMSHEIRNPLNGVVGLCEMLRVTASTTREQSLATTLQGCADQLRSLLDDVLDWGKIERGEIDLAKEPFALDALIESACRSMDVQLARVTWTAPTDAWLVGDAAKVRQIVMNLVGNGLKHGTPPMATVAAGIEWQGDQGRLRIRVGNPAPSTSPEELEGFFAEYQRGDEARRRKVPGLGLGLHISRRLAGAMGGVLDGSYENGRIEFALQLALPKGARPATMPAAISGCGAVRVLAIEDEPYNRLVQGHYLKQLGCTVDWATDVAGLRACLRGGTYDVILTDYNLPDFTGAQIARLIRAELKDRCPPIVAVTAYATEEKRAEGEASGICEFVTKPVSAAKLAATLRRRVLRAGATIETVAGPDRADIAGEFDFSALRQLESPHAALADYAAVLEESRLNIARLSGPAGAKAVHALRSQVLLVRALELGAQLELLEAALREDDAVTAARLSAVTMPWIEQLADAARQAAKRIT